MEAAGVTINPVADKRPFVERVRGLHEDFLRLYPKVDPSLLDRIRQEAELP
jgi:hypothetical protein